MPAISQYPNAANVVDTDQTVVYDVGANTTKRANVGLIKPKDLQGFDGVTISVMSPLTDWSLLPGKFLEITGDFVLNFSTRPGKSFAFTIYNSSSLVRKVTGGGSTDVNFRMGGWLYILPGRLVTCAVGTEDPGFPSFYPVIPLGGGRFKGY